MNLLDTIVLPSSVKSLGQCAFTYCTNLKSINLPVTQKTLPVSFFEGCTSLETIELPATLTTISSDAFYGCSKLANVNLHEGITTIGLRAFWGCKLTEITIPSTVTSIGNGAFKGNPTTTIVWKPKTCSIGSDDSAPFYSTSSQVTSFTFAEDVEVVPAYLCKWMNQLDSIVLPATVTSVGASAFMYCKGIQSFTFPKGIKTVATSVLEGCSALEEVTIPSTVTTINQDAFYGCSALRAMHNYANTHMKIVTGLLKRHPEIRITPKEIREEAQKWQIPLAPRIEGFTFLKWEVQAGDLAEGIVLQAVYQANTPTDHPADVVVNPTNHAQKLIRNGNMYILHDEQIYTITGNKITNR